MGVLYFHLSTPILKLLRTVLTRSCMYIEIAKKFIGVERSDSKAIYVLLTSSKMLFSAMIFYTTVSFFGFLSTNSIETNTRFYTSAILIAPILETLIAQFGVFEICLSLQVNKSLCFYISWCAFFVMHLENDLFSALVAGLPAGYFLSKTYLVWRQDSKRVAVVMTTTCHCVYNAVICLLIYIGK